MQYYSHFDYCQYDSWDYYRYFQSAQRQKCLYEGWWIKLLLYLWNRKRSHRKDRKGIHLSYQGKLLFSYFRKCIKCGIMSSIKLTFKPWTKRNMMATNYLSLKKLIPTILPGSLFEGPNFLICLMKMRSRNSINFLPKLSPNSTNLKVKLVPILKKYILLGSISWKNSKKITKRNDDNCFV